MSIDSNALFTDWKWQPPKDWNVITTIDTHTGGEPLRIVTGGLPAIPGATVLEKRRFFMTHYDHLRQGLMREPRGHADMYGAVLTPSADDADLDVFFLNSEGYSPMCGHAILAIAKVVLETGLVKKAGPNPELTLNTPAGRNYARARIEDGEVRHAYFRNVPSFVYLRDERVNVPGIGEVAFDVAYGGAFYAIVEAAPLKLELTAQHYNRLIDYGRRIKAAVVQNFKIEHPFAPDLSFLFGTIFTGAPLDPAHHSRNVCIFEDGEVDRSPTGTGVSARAALHHARGELPIKKTITIESILGSTMTVSVVESTEFGPYAAIVPEVGGSAHIMGRSTCYFDPRDPFTKGFIFR